MVQVGDYFGLDIQEVVQQLLEISSFRWAQILELPPPEDFYPSGQHPKTKEIFTYHDKREFIRPPKNV